MDEKECKEREWNGIKRNGIEMGEVGTIGSMSDIIRSCAYMVRISAYTAEWPIE